MVTKPLYLTHGTYNCYVGKLACRCQPCRQAMKEYVDRWRRKHGKTVGPFTVSCVTCGVQFQSVQSGAKYCSATCKRKHEHGTKRTCRSCSRRYLVSTEPTPIVVGLCRRCRQQRADSMTTCLLCGVDWWDGDGQTYCSKDCEELAAMRKAIIEKDFL